MTKENKIEEIVKLEDKDLIVQTVLDEDKWKTYFLIKQNEEISKKDKIELKGITYVPIPISSQYINKKTLRLPTRIEEYGSKDNLLDEIKKFIHSYMDISEEFETVSAYYVLLSWVYEGFNNLPYMRVRAKPGNGKSRYLNIMADLVFNAMHFKGPPSEAVLFRTIDKIKGTLVYDEADFRYSDRTNLTVQVFTNGFEKGGGVSRVKQTQNGDFEPVLFDTFGPKVIGNIKIFKDDALESRCITEVLEKINIRQETTLDLDEKYYQKAEILRNKLLKFRFDFLRKIKIKEVEFKISLRGKQIARPLLSIMDSEKDIKHLETLMLLSESNLESIRDNTLNTDVVKVLAEKYFKKEDKVSVQEITNKINDGDESWNKMTPKKMGSILQDLNIKRKRAGANGNTTISISDNLSRIEYLIKYHNIKKEDICINWNDDLNTEDTELSEFQKKVLSEEDEFNF